MKPNDLAPAKVGACKVRTVRRAVACAMAALALVTTSLVAPPAAPAGLGLHVELNKVEDIGGSCHGSFMIRNSLGHTLDRFSMELILFGRDGVIKRSILVDMAPLPDDKTTVVTFVLSEGRCADLGRVLVNKFPACTSRTGEKVDCLSGLDVSSRSGLEFFK